MERFAQFGTSLLAIFCLTCVSSQVLAQVVDTEPNNSCSAPQDAGPLNGGPVAVSGSLDTPPDEPDVDFFRFEAAPGADLVADLQGEFAGQGTLPDPLLGLFDSDCNLLDLNDDASDSTLDSRLLFFAPADGIIILAATGFPDFDFIGRGEDSGSYVLSIAPAPPPIGSIAGRVVDATTGEPLPGDSPPFALVDLLRCDGFDCFELVAEQPTDEGGRFRFERDFDGQPLRAGTYQIIAFANEFEENATEPFDVAGGEDVDVGDLALALQPISFSDIQPCEDLLPQGDSCRYSVTVRNNTDAPLEGLAWSVVDGFGIPSGFGFTRFEASTFRGSRQAVRAPVAVEPSANQALRFRFDVPAFALGAEFCTEIWLGVNPEPLVTTIRQAFLFCIIGTQTGFQVMSEREGQQIARSLRGRSGALAPAKPGKRPAK